MKKLNVFWILVDSARNFQTDVDDRGLPKSVEQFGTNNIFVKNVVTSAPSTFMSISSIMASVPSYLIARNYNNIPDVSDFYPTLPHILKKEGFSIIGSLYYKHGREILSKLFGALPKKYFPKGLSHSKPFWTNIDVLNVFESIIKEIPFCR